MERTLTAGDNAAAEIAEWRTDGYKHPSLAPDDVRAREREKLKQWVKEQAALIRAGKKSLSLSDKPKELISSQWRVDAP